ncbi:Pre-mRNA-splicing factor 18 [Lamellibrachia satsuma]|nr:Pre-mRNA-splicing factor 18 [Lamellibrachia satsuma]
MDLIKAEIERKKREIESSDVLAPSKKYFKRGDLAAKQTEEYWKKHKKHLLINKAKEADNDDSAASSSQSGQEEKHRLSRKEVIWRLRERAEPITLFGETEEEAFQRLKKLEMLEPEVDKGFKNDMQTAMDRMERTTDVKVKDDIISIEEILKSAESLGKGDTPLDCDVILNFLKLILKKWGDALNSRDVQDKMAFRGKLTSAMHTQTVSYIKPLFRSLKTRVSCSNWVDFVKSGCEKSWAEVQADSFSFECRGCARMKELEVELEELRLLVVAIVGREQGSCASSSGGGTVDDKVGKDTRGARESSPQPGRKLRGGKVTCHRETGRETGGKEKGVEETGGKTTGVKERGVAETGGKEKGVGETGGKTTGVKEKGVGETEGKTTGVKERGVGETRAKEWEVGETGGKGSGQNVMEGIERKSYSAAVIEGVRKRARVFVGDLIVRKTDRVLNKGDDVVVCLPGAKIEAITERDVDPGILVCLVDIVRFLLDRNYLKANDAYLEMAIGNAPWPIGVTMVGIHARTGREKIFARNVAHVLNDETQRKYIQALKRLMTQCQTFFPTDPSRSVEYEPTIK